MELRVVDGRVGVETKRFIDCGGRCVVTGVPVDSVRLITIDYNYQFIN